MAAEVTGLREALKAMQEVGAEVEDLKEVMGDIASTAADVMRPFIPKRSGALANTARGNRAKGKAVVTVGRARVGYAGPINYGWRARNIAPADFTGKTDRVMETRAAEMLETGLTKIITEKGLGQ
ncbi:MAG TPA: hypothetical protein VFH70_07725 [Acidimicrobiales bacterium]|nr:hypothetical protein [Acidimicrobiales bacterium]